VREFIVSIVVDIVGHVGVQLLKCCGIGWISTSTGDFAVRNASEFVVLHPEIGL